MEKYKYEGQKMKVVKGAGRLSTREKADGMTFVAEDYWMNITGKSWKHVEGNPAIVEYIVRSMNNIQPPPMDERVVYGKIGNFGHLFHENELIPLDDIQTVTHELKISRECYESILSVKRKAIIHEKDREFRANDFIILREWNDGDYTDRCMAVRVTDILDDPHYCKQGYVVMSIEDTSVPPDRIRSYPRRRY